VLGCWNFLFVLKDGKTPQTQLSVEIKYKKYNTNLTRKGNCNVLAHSSSVRVLRL